MLCPKSMVAERFLFDLLYYILSAYMDTVEYT